ncbi:MAG: hypothetical protein RL172_469 [Bacteroidota bacterium]|jgi:hypothetical protein
MNNHRFNQYWTKWYVAVLVFLILQIALYYFITTQFN